MAPVKRKKSPRYPSKTRKVRKREKAHAQKSSQPNRRFMRLAIAEMLRSRSEHASKPDPLVGAVLVNSTGRIVGKAHRGKYGEGEHGEFTLLEKPGIRISPQSTLYVTLEPCTRRGHRKIPCAQRIIDAGISRVVIGIKDPNPVIWGEGEKRLRQASVVVDFFDRDLADEIRHHNAQFIADQEAKAKEIQTVQLKSPDRHENLPVNAASVDDFSESNVRLYLNKIRKNYTIPSIELWEYFANSGFVTHGDTRGKFKPTIAGIVLFAKEPHQFLPQARIKADQFPGSPDDPMFMERATAQLDIKGPLSDQVEATLKFFNGNVRRVPIIIGAQREVVPEYPEIVIREAIVNALVHRSYENSAHTFLYMYRDRIVIRSPGLPLEPLKISMFPDHVFAVPRNPRIAQAAFEMGFMDARGYGIRNMPERLREYGLRDPEFAADRGSFVITLLGREMTSFKLRADRRLIATLSPRQLQIVEFTESKPSIRSEDIVKHFGVSKQTTANDLNKLIRLKVLGRTGTGRSTSYFLLRD
jgi:ATP-dependent DNA helicase RecG